MSAGFSILLVRQGAAANHLFACLRRVFVQYLVLPRRQPASCTVGPAAEIAATCLKGAALCDTLISIRAYQGTGPAFFCSAGNPTPYNVMRHGRLAGWNADSSWLRGPAQALSCCLGQEGTVSSRLGLPRDHRTASTSWRASCRLRSTLRLRQLRMQQPAALQASSERHTLCTERRPSLRHLRTPER